MLKSIKVLGFLAVLLLASPAVAADLRWNTGSDNPNLQIAETEQTRNLYTAGPNVVVNANVGKDLTVAGSNLEINGNVGDSLLAAGGSVNVSGDVGGSARIAGGQIRIQSKKITEDLVIAAGTVYISTDTVIVGDLLVAGGNVTVDGTVNGNVKFTGGVLTLNGQVNGNVDAKAKQSFILGPKADIGGTVNYSSREEYIRDPAAKTSAVNFTPLPKGHGAQAVFTFLTFAFFIKLIAGLIVGWLLYRIFRRRFVAAVQATGEDFWKNVGYGLVWLIVVPVVVGVAIATLIGFYAAVIVILVYALIFLISWIVGAAYFGSWLISKIEKKALKVDYVTIAVGVVLASILKFVPVVGWLFAVIITLAAMGYFVRNFKNLKE